MVEPCISAAQGAIPGFLDLDVKKYMLLGTQEETIKAMLRYLLLNFFLKSFSEGWSCCLLHFHLFNSPQLVITTPYPVYFADKELELMWFLCKTVDMLPYSMWAVDTELSLALTYVILLLPLYLAPSEPKGQIWQVPLKWHKCIDLLHLAGVGCACYCSIEHLTPWENSPASKI